jgi:hypothetical protein
VGDELLNDGVITMLCLDHDDVLGTVGVDAK